MTVERQIDYEALAQDAMRGVVRTILKRVSEQGLPGEHHFYISFNTLAPGVQIAPRLLAKYPNEMTIVLQHRFWDLHVQQDRFEVKLTFDSIRERLVVPFAAVRVFFDPSVPYGMQFEEAGSDRRAASETDGFGADGFGSAAAGAAKSAGKAAGDRKKSTRKTKIESLSDMADATTPERAPATDKSAKPATAPASAASVDGQPVKPAAKTGPRLVESANDSAKVVSLDQFRKK